MFIYKKFSVGLVTTYHITSICVWHWGRKKWYHIVVQQVLSSVLRSQGFIIPKAVLVLPSYTGFRNGVREFNTVTLENKF